MITVTTRVTLLTLMTVTALSACSFHRRRGLPETIQVQALYQGRPLAASCQLVNERGRWQVRQTPGSATIERGVGNLVVVCQQGSLAPGFTTVVTGHENAVRAEQPGGAQQITPPPFARYPSAITVNMGQNQSITLPRQ